MQKLPGLNMPIFNTDVYLHYIYFWTSITVYHIAFQLFQPYVIFRVANNCRFSPLPRSAYLTRLDPLNSLDLRHLDPAIINTITQQLTSGVHLQKHKVEPSKSLSAGKSFTAQFKYSSGLCNFDHQYKRPILI